MNGPVGVDRRIGELFAQQAPHPDPESVLAATFAVTSRTRQRARWLPVRTAGSRAWLPALAAAALLALLLAGLFLVGRPPDEDEPRPTPPPASPTAAASPSGQAAGPPVLGGHVTVDIPEAQPLGDRLLARIELSAAPRVLVATGEQLFVGATDADGRSGGRLFRIALAGDVTEVATEAVPCLDMAVAFDRIWTLDCSDAIRLVALDPDGGSVDREVAGAGECRCPTGPQSRIEQDGEFVWAVPSVGSGPLVRLAGVDEPEETIYEPANEVLVGAGSAWVVETGNNVLAKLDGASGGVRTELHVEGYGSPMAMVGDAPWLWNATESSFARFNPNTYQVAGSAGMAIEPQDAVAGAGATLWIADRAGRRLIRFDTGTFTVDAVLDIGELDGDLSLAWAAGQLWVAGSDNGTVLRIADG